MGGNRLGHLELRKCEGINCRECCMGFYAALNYYLEDRMEHIQHIPRLRKMIIARFRRYRYYWKAKRTKPNEKWHVLQKRKTTRSVCMFSIKRKKPVEGQRSVYCFIEDRFGKEAKPKVCGYYLCYR